MSSLSDYQKSLLTPVELIEKERRDIEQSLVMISRELDRLTSEVDSIHFLAHVTFYWLSLSREQRYREMRQFVQGAPHVVHEVLLLPVEVLQLPTYAEHALWHGGISYLWQLVMHSPRELRKIPRLGPKSLQVIEDILPRFALELDMELSTVEQKRYETYTRPDER